MIVKIGLRGLMLSVLLLTGCQSTENQDRQKAEDAVSAPFAAGAITLQLRAEPGLNTVNGLPNSCTVLVVQSRDRATLNKILSNPVTLKSLFAGAGADAGGEGDVLQVDRYAIMPGQINTLHIDRVLNTRSVGFVAGYYPFPTKAHMISRDVPVKSESSGWWSPVWQASLAPLNLAVTLGSEGIVNAELPPEKTSATESASEPAAVEDKK